MPAPAAPDSTGDLFGGERKGPPESVEKSMERVREAAEKSAPITDKKDAKSTKDAKDTVKDLEIPGFLKKELVDQWEKLDPVWKDQLREAASRIGGVTEKYGKAAKSWNEFQTEWSQRYAPMFNPGVHPRQVINETMGIIRNLRQGSDQEKLHTLSTIIDDFKLMPIIERAQQAAATGAPLYDPNNRAMHNELLAARAQQEAREFEASRHADMAAENEFERWQASANAVHLEKVGGVMADLLQSNIAHGYQDAYDKALRLEDETFNGMIQAKASEQLATKASEAQRAMSAAVSPRPDGMSSPMPSGIRTGRAESVEETLARVRRDQGYQ